MFQGGGPYWGGLVPVVRNGRVSFNPFLSTSVLQNFGAAYYRVQERIMVNAAAVRSNSGEPFDFEVSASNFHLSELRSGCALVGGCSLGGYTLNGRDTVFKGTYWTLFDAKGIARPPEGPLARITTSASACMAISSISTTPSG